MQGFIILSSYFLNMFDIFHSKIYVCKSICENPRNLVLVKLFPRYVSKPSAKSSTPVPSELYLISFQTQLSCEQHNYNSVKNIPQALELFIPSINDSLSILCLCTGLGSETQSEPSMLLAHKQLTVSSKRQTSHQAVAFTCGRSHHRGGRTWVPLRGMTCIVSRKMFHTSKWRKLHVELQH